MTTDDQGFSDRIFTEKEEELVIWVGDGEWTSHEEFETLNSRETNYDLNMQESNDDQHA